MSGVGRQDFLLVALVASVLVHAGLMAVMRPQVMAHVSAVAGRRVRMPMKVAEAVERAKPVSMSSVRDVAAVRESPTAEADSLMPVSAALDAPAPAPDADSPDVAPVVAPASADVSFEEPPALSEIIHVEDAPTEFSVAAAEEYIPTAVPPAASAAAPAASHAVSEAPAPSAAAPEFRPNFHDDGLADAVSDAVAPNGPPQTDAYIPVAEVLAHVDERVVEEEKAAVRGLLDVRDAGELSKMVELSSASASSGGWTYFRVSVMPTPALSPTPKDVVVLLDASGSIGDDRLRSCRAAARKILRSCTNTGDRFNLVAFRDRFTYAFRSWQECDSASFKKADRWLDALASHGRTDVFAVIRSVLTLPRSPSRPLVALVVTDGDANAGVRETAQILSRFTALNDGLVSVYMYGVKESANRELIDVLTHGNRGESFIYGGSRWKAGSGIESLSERFRDPVLSDLRVVFPSNVRAEAYPRLLRNLYRGGSVEFVGRVPNGTNKVSFSLRGLNGADAYEGFFNVDLAKASFDAALPEAWAREAAIAEKLR